ncbi:VTC domain-containing protein [Gongronella butleri]|nr:VTC domain-containing protein [Gongronella butleri]
MKFGEELNSKVYEPWRHYYVQYDEVSSELKRKLKDHGRWRDRNERDFQDLFQREMAKVYNFVMERMDVMSTRVEQLETRTLALKDKPPADADKKQAAYDMLADDLAEVLFDINDLSRFHQLNVIALEKLVKRHDKWTHHDFRTRYESVLLGKYPLDKCEIDVLIVKISHLQDVCRLCGEARSKKAYAQGGDQTAFERATSKFWIHPDNITEVKSILLMYLPIHVFNQKKNFESADAAVSSVYFDNDQFDLYAERLERSTGAEAIRFRWYGSNTKDVYIERKTHHAPWLEGKSVKDRFRLRENLVTPFCQGSYTADDLVADLSSKNKLDEPTIEQNAFIARGVQSSFQNRQLQPMVRVFYNRTAFQLPGDQRLRISLDTNLTFIREDHMDGRLRREHTGNWRRQDIGTDYPFRQVPPQDILRFPYAILETKIQTHLGQEAPPWLMSLLNSHLVHEVPRFSKYLHGASQLYKEAIPVLPWWMPELEKDIRKERVEKVGLSRSLSFKPLFNGHHRSSLALTDVTNEPSAEKSVEKCQSLPHIAIKLSDTMEPTVTNEKERTGTTTPVATPKNGHQQQRDLLSRLWKSNSAFLPSKKHDDIPPILPRTQSQSMAPMTPRFLEKVKKPDPKAFFANERTFISWLQFCALLLTVALNLLNTGDGISRMIGAIFIVIASVMSLYALARFQLRAYLMRTGKNHLRMDDIYGPVVLCVLLVVALMLNFYLRLPMLTTNYDEAIHADSVPIEDDVPL